MSPSKMPKKNKKPCFETNGRPESTASALSEAQAICAAQGRRLTDLRYAVLQEIWRSEKPAGAYEILAALKNDFPRAAPISIYRALDFLTENGLIHRLNSLNAFIGCRRPEEKHVPAFLICSVCGRADEIRADKAFKELKKETGKFKPKSAAIEIFGVCPSCRK